MTDETSINALASAGAFEWDENKRRSNVAKHGIDFVDARDAFSDPRAFTYISRSTPERRFVTVGVVRNLLMAIVFTIRSDAIRIISARAARRDERQMYG